MLGIPVVLDRLIQQAILQVISPIFDPDFSEYSYGFRPGRSAIQAVEKAREYMADGYRWVVDLDLEKYFDQINHDILMSRLARKIKDKRLLKLIRKYLQSGLMVDGVVSPRVKGTPQGSLCKALHKPPYEKLMIMQSKSLKLPDFQHFK